MMTSPMTSQGGLKVGPLYSFINEITTFFRSKAQISEIPMIILLVYSTSGITSGKKVCRDLKMAAIFKI